MTVLTPGYPYAAYGPHYGKIPIAQGCRMADMSWGSHQDLAEWCSAQADCYDDVPEHGWIFLENPFLYAMWPYFRCVYINNYKSFHLSVYLSAYRSINLSICLSWRCKAFRVDRQGGESLRVAGPIQILWAWLSMPFEVGISMYSCYGMDWRGPQFT